METYHNKWAKKVGSGKTYQHVDENYVHHEGAWALAINIHYTIKLGGNLGAVVIWQVKVNDSLNPPEEARAYER